jgi:hypothetical protein
VVDNLEVSSRALTILAAGGRAGRRVNLDLFVEQVTDTGRFWMAIFELNATHPFLSKRVAAIRASKGLTTRASVPRPILAYPLAPILGIAGGGPILLVAIATYAVILGAMPSLMKKYGLNLPGKTASTQVAPRLDDGPPPTDEAAAPNPR